MNNVIQVQLTGSNRRYIVSWVELNDHFEQGKSQLFTSLKQAKQFVAKLKAPD